LRFPEFTGEWKECELKDIANFSKGAGISKDQLSETGESCILYGELYTKYKSEVISNVISKTDIENSNLVWSKANDVIIPSSGETAIDISTARCVPYDNILLGGDLNIIRLKDQDGRFFSYQLNGVRKLDIAQIAQGVSVVHLYGESLKRLKVRYPSKSEQVKISSLLSVLDERIETQNRIIDKLKSLMKGLNDYLQDSVPLSYSLSFSDIGEDYSGLSGKTAEDFGSGKPYITYVSIYANNFVDDDCSGKVSVERGEKQNVVQKGDMLFTLSSETPEEVCYGAVYSGNSTETYLNSFCFGVRNTEEKVFSPYMAYFFNSSRFRREVYPLAQGSTRFNLQKSDFLQKQFSYPSIENQHRIFEILNAYDNKIKVENQILAHYQLQKDFLLRNLFI
jgi:type I restriction enzyme S subunit